MSKSLWSSLGINPKTSFYFSNGTGRAIFCFRSSILNCQLLFILKKLIEGRDTYIMNDNGGTVKARPVSGFP